MSHKIRHCPRCRSKNIMSWKGEPDMRYPGAKLVNVTCADCGYKSRVVVRKITKRGMF